MRKSEKRNALVPAVLCAICVLCGAFLDARAQAPPASGSLETLAPFIGGTWIAEGELPGVGKYVAKETYRWSLGSKFIEMEQVTTAGETQSRGKTIIGWHPGKKRVVAWNFGDDGKISMAECDCTASDTFTFQGRFVGGGSGRTNFKWTSADSYAAILEVEHDGVWRKERQFESKRKALEPSVPNSPASWAAELQALEPLVGAWTQTTSYTSGTNYTTELEFRWILGGRFLMSEYRILGTENAGVHAVSFIGYDAEQKRIVQYGFSADGTVGTFHFSPAGAPELVFEGEMQGRQRRQLRVRYQRRDADTLSAITEIQQQGIFQPMGNSTMRRKKAGTGS